MSFIEELKKEVNLYLENLQIFKNYDFEYVNSCLNNWIEEILNYQNNMESQKSSYEKQISNCNLIAEKLDDRNRDLRALAYKQSKKILKKKVSFPDNILHVQQEIEELNETLNNFAGTKEVDLSGKKDIEAVKKLVTVFESNIKHFNGELKKIYSDPMNSQYPILLRMLGANYENKVYEDYFNTLKGVVVNLLNLSNYKNLITVLSLSIPGMPFAAKCSGLFNDSTLSVVCGKTFNSIIFKNELSVNTNEKLFDEIIDNERIVYTEEGICIAQNDDNRLKNKKMFSVQFLNELLKLSEENKDKNLPLFAIVLAKNYANTDNSLLSSLEKFRILYEETPEQVMVRDNKYYEEQRLEEMEYQARREEKRREREAEREEAFRQRQLRIQEEAARAEQRRWEEDKRREDRQREEDRRREQAEERRRQQEANKQAADALKAKMEAQRLCVRCANYGRGCRGGIVGCGNYKAK